EGDERRNDDGDLALTEGGGGLVAEGFAAAGREDDERVPAFEHGPHRLFLEGAQAGEAPVPGDDGLEIADEPVGRGGDGGHVQRLLDTATIPVWCADVQSSKYIAPGLPGVFAGPGQARGYIISARRGVRGRTPGRVGPCGRSR